MSLMKYQIAVTLSVLVIAISTTTTAADNHYQKPSDIILKQRLTPMQYDVTQHQGTEPPYNNAYWHNDKPGIYVDIVTGEPLFSSIDKYDSKTGWPSFTKPIEPNNIVLNPDNSMLMTRIEVES